MTYINIIKLTVAALVSFLKTADVEFKVKQTLDYLSLVYRNSLTQEATFS